MKKFIFPLFLMFASCDSGAQNAKTTEKKIETKMEAFASKTGIIIKFVDYKLPNLRLYLGEVAETRIRKLISDGTVRYFYQIEKDDQYNNTTASIEYSDLLEVIKAISTLKSAVEKDNALNPDYLENKFTTVDGFQVGYYIGDKKSKWYLKLEKYGSNNTLFINDVTTLENAFSEAKIKIEEIKLL